MATDVTCAFDGVATGEFEAAFSGGQVDLLYGLVSQDVLTLARGWVVDFFLRD